MYTTRPCQPRPAAHGGAARRRQRELDATTVRRRPLPLHQASIHQAARDHRDGALVRQRTLRKLAGRECAAGAAQLLEHEELRGGRSRCAAPSRAPTDAGAGRCGGWRRGRRERRRMHGIPWTASVLGLAGGGAQPFGAHHQCRVNAFASRRARGLRRMRRLVLVSRRRFGNSAAADRPVFSSSSNARSALLLRAAISSSIVLK